MHRRPPGVDLDQEAATVGGPGLAHCQRQGLDGRQQADSFQTIVKMNFFQKKIISSQPNQKSVCALKIFECLTKKLEKANCKILASV